MIAGLALMIAVAVSGEEVVGRSSGTTSVSKIETFSFSSKGKATRAKIYLPAAYETEDNLPAIYLIDFTEQHFKVATDEFEKVIDGVVQVQGFDALVVSLERIPDIDAEPEVFQEHYQIYKDMASYVDENYTKSVSRTLIGKGSESGIVLMALLQDNVEGAVFENFIATDPSGLYATAIIDILESGDIPRHALCKKLHFSFSTSNDREKCKKLINLIDEAKFPWLQFEFVEYTESNYDNTYSISFPEGIKFVFGK